MAASGPGTTRTHLKGLGLRPLEGWRDVPALLGWAGLLPMIALALIAAIGGLGDLTAARSLDALVDYAAIALGFLGGVRWGLAMRVETERLGVVTIALSVLPAAVAWLSILLPTSIGLAVLAAGFAAQGAWDVWTADAGRAPSWYGRLRLRISVAVVVILAIALAVSGH